MIYVCEFTQNNWRERLAGASLQAGLVSASEVEALWQGNERVIRHRREHLSAWLLFLYALRTEYGMTELSSLQLAKHPHGKPYSVAHPELFFNLSHCKSACACVLADRPVGIDVERKLSYKEALMRRICTEEEQALFADCQNDRPALGALANEGKLCETGWAWAFPWTGSGVMCGISAGI